MNEPMYSLKVAKAAISWADANLKEGGETLSLAMGETLPNDSFPSPEALMFIRDWVVSNPLKVMQMTPEGLAGEIRNVEQTADQMAGQRFPCSLKEAVEAFGSGIMPSNLEVTTSEEEKAKRSFHAYLRKRKLL